jgi:hypothetical protein
MAYASITYTSASGTTFALTNSSGDPIPYLRQADIAVTVNGTLKIQGTDYTFNSAGTAIVFSVAVSNATVSISRITDISDATVVYTAGSTLTAQDLNNADNQIRFGLQEFSDTYAALTTGTGDLQVLGGFIGSAETWTADNAHAATTGAIDGRIDSKIDTALTTDVVAGDSLTITDNSPASGQITIGVTNASISTAKLVDSSVTTAKIADGNVTTAKILDSNVTTAKIADSNVTTAKIADSAVTSAKIADGTIVASDLASDAVTTAKILDANVTTGKIADGAVTTGKLADSSVTSAKIADGTIVAGDLASDSVTTAKILDANVTTAKIADSNVTTGKIADSAVTAIKIADGVITSAKLNASTVVTNAEQSASTPDDTSFFTTSASDARYDARYVNVTGDTMSGALAMGSNKITDLGTPTANADAATKLYVDNSVAAGVGDADYGDITVSGTGTVWTIDSGVVTSAKIADDTIVNADINSAAAIAHTKLANITAGSVLMGNASNVPTATALSGDVTIDSSGATAISSGVIVNADINASAAIAGTKISPDFGSQNTTTTGTSTAASFIPTSSSAPTNGVYLPSANNVAISTNGTGRLFVDSSGRVGVGTTDPYGRINVQRDTANQFSTISLGDFADANNSVGIYGRVGSSGLFGISTAGSPIVFYNGGSGTTERLRLTTTGALNFVGAGTAGSTQAVSFNGSAPINSLVIDSSGRVGLGSSSPGRRLVIAGDTNTVCAIQGANNGTSSLFLGDTDAESIGAFTYNHVGNHLEVTVNAAERMRIDSSGRVGIGTTSPQCRLHVSNGGANGFEFFPDLETINSYNRSSSAFTPLNINAAQHIFLTSSTEAARIDSSRRLLVGTSSASDASKFVVQGQVGANAGQMSVRRNAVGADATILGSIDFDDSSASLGARIQAVGDAAWGTNDYPTRLVFSTTADGASSPTERMRIRSDGQTYWVSSDPTTTSYGTSIGRAGLPGLFETYRNAGSTNSVINAGGNAGQVVVYGDGDLENTNNRYTGFSDIRLKQNIEDSGSQWDDIKNVRVRKYELISDPSRRQIGVIAQELELTSPGLVVERGDDTTGETHKSVAYSVLYMKAVKALQEAMERIETLEAKVAALEAS